MELIHKDNEKLIFDYSTSIFSEAINSPKLSEHIKQTSILSALYDVLPYTDYSTVLVDSIGLKLLKPNKYIEITEDTTIPLNEKTIAYGDKFITKNYRFFTKVSFTQSQRDELISTIKEYEYLVEIDSFLKGLDSSLLPNVSEVLSTLEKDCDVEKLLGYLYHNEDNLSTINECSGIMSKLVKNERIHKLLDAIVTRDVDPNYAITLNCLRFLLLCEDGELI